MVVCGAGTGGTIAGIGRKFKEKIPECEVSKGKGQWRTTWSLQLILSTVHMNMHFNDSFLSFPSPLPSPLLPSLPSPPLPKVVGVDPVGSVLARPPELNTKEGAYQVRTQVGDSTPTYIKYDLLYVRMCTNVCKVWQLCCKELAFAVLTLTTHFSHSHTLNPPSLPPLTKAFLSLPPLTPTLTSILPPHSHPSPIVG